ncbi:SRPBCC family protein [Roseateles saccharophilus]|uniref:Polyketide cyclase/dehydrase/lipid transport protein n=1 Tax=Roseateles saccharophilus TaxID=304 RepID=A0A4R3VBE6_ROSSA|nr:SRPBCC family protein [Roseateles saccharophilus]MDG0831661.1 polyketide cyclase [Roseateles saccharophilus]TCV00924.1 polyketide cyclase/dehydrase/lipid transport protein [Roseateles saccharophilus]
MSKFSIVLICLAAAVLLLMAYASTRPGEFSVERRLRIAAPADRLWPLVGELRGFNRWNPYERKDPLIKGRYDGAAAGIGSRYAWESDKVGTGSLEITGQQPGRAVQMKLEFVKPFEAHNQAEFALRPTADGATEVSWRMHGPANFMHKLMGLFMDMDKLVGSDFEDGLQNLRQIAEGGQG